MSHRKVLGWPNLSWRVCCLISPPKGNCPLWLFLLRMLARWEARKGMQCGVQVSETRSRPEAVSRELKLLLAESDTGGFQRLGLPDLRPGKGRLRGPVYKGLSPTKECLRPCSEEEVFGNAAAFPGMRTMQVGPDSRI